MVGRMCSKRTTQGLRNAHLEARGRVVQAEEEEVRWERGEGLDTRQGSEEEWMILFLHE